MSDAPSSWATMSASQLSLSELFAASPLPMALIALDDSGDSKVLAGNDVLAALLGVPSAVGCNVGDFVDERDRNDLAAARERLINGDVDVLRNVQRIVVADGGTVQVLSLAFVYGREPGRTLLAELWLAWDEFTRIQQQVQGGELLSTALADLRARLLRDEPTQTVLESICSWASRLLGGDSACIMEFDDGGVLTITAVGEHAPTSMIGSQWQLNRAEFGEALAARQTTSYKVSPSELVESHTEYPSPPMLVEDLHLAMAPVLAVDRTLGALIVCRSGREFDSERELLELFASEVSAALTLDTSACRSRSSRSRRGPRAHRTQPS